TTSTYRYTAYGQADKTGTTGDDAIFDNDPAKTADIVNPYRFNSKRFDGATGTYDMGFREYNPGLNRYLTRDMFNGALQDLALGTDPWNTNRYAFAGGNPINRIELDGHYAIDENGEPYKYWEVWNERHETAVEATADQTQVEHPERGRVTTSRKDNLVAGGSSGIPAIRTGIRM
ncbi:RHS repeat-associated protein, partial [Kribbella sp. VKM Ac-2569]|uniref:RHS repeat-associated core domain-containing protein n=1 Tax=Kribbella sp. VKM Ac-2569 TaxID=2512220 RepID=UPI00102CB34C